jgi:hypothetical protein
MKSDNINYYQSIPELGIEGRLDTQNEFKKIGMPIDLKDWEVMDIGANIGAFCYEAKRRGAGLVVAVEPNLDWNLLGQGISQELNASIDWFYVMPSIEVDLVLLLSVLHVCDNPQGILDSAWKLTRKLLIVEINERLQETKLKAPYGEWKEAFYGKNKDGRSVYHFSKDNGRG